MNIEEEYRTAQERLQNGYQYFDPLAFLQAHKPSLIKRVGMLISDAMSNDLEKAKRVQARLEYRNFILSHEPYFKNPRKIIFNDIYWLQRLDYFKTPEFAKYMKDKETVEKLSKYRQTDKANVSTMQKATAKIRDKNRKVGKRRYRSTKPMRTKHWVS